MRNSPATPAAFRPPPRRTSPLTPLVRVVVWHRRKLAALCAMAAVASTIAAVSPSPPPTVPVVVAARALPGGQALAAEDLKIAGYPLELAPEGHLSDPAELAGRTLISDAGRGQPLGTAAVVAPREAKARPGHVTVPIRLMDSAVATLLRVGDRVDVVASVNDGLGAGGSGARVVASDARVLALPTSPETGDGPFGGGESSGVLVLLEVSADKAVELAQLQTTTRVTVVFR